MNPLVTSAAPIQIEQGTSDTTVFPVYTDQLKDELVNAGNQVTYKKYPGVDHVASSTPGRRTRSPSSSRCCPPRLDCRCTPGRIGGPGSR